MFKNILDYFLPKYRPVSSLNNTHVLNIRVIIVGYYEKSWNSGNG